MTCNNIAKRQRGGSTSSRTQFRGGKNLVFDVLSIFQTQRLRKIHEILVIFMHFSQRISGSFSAPREVLISSLVPLESSFYKLSSGTRLDVGSSRGAECERERVRSLKAQFWFFARIFFSLRGLLTPRAPERRYLGVFWPAVHAPRIIFFSFCNFPREFLCFSLRKSVEIRMNF